MAEAPEREWTVWKMSIAPGARTKYTLKIENGIVGLYRDGKDKPKKEYHLCDVHSIVRVEKPDEIRNKLILKKKRGKDVQLKAENPDQCKELIDELRNAKAAVGDLRSDDDKLSTASSASSDCDRRLPAGGHENPHIRVSVESAEKNFSRAIEHSDSDSDNRTTSSPSADDTSSQKSVPVPHFFNEVSESSSSDEDVEIRQKGQVALSKHVSEDSGVGSAPTSEYSKHETLNRQTDIAEYSTIAQESQSVRERSAMLEFDARIQQSESNA